MVLNKHFSAKHNGLIIPTQYICEIEEAHLVREETICEQQHKASLIGAHMKCAKENVKILTQDGFNKE